MKFLIILLSVGLFGACSHGRHKWEKMDSNKDGKLSKDEFMAHFGEMDLNSDGFVTKEEKKSYRKNSCSKK